MRLTRSVGYAVSVLLNVERRGARVTMTAADISRNCQFPPRFLYRILRRLVDSGLLTGVSGPGGGYRLARGAETVTLQEIVVAVEGPQDAGQLESACAAHQLAIDSINELCATTARRFNADLKRVKLSDLAELARPKTRRKKPGRKAKQSRAARKKPARSMATTKRTKARRAG